jgi:hypothetical protein
MGCASYKVNIKRNDLLMNKNRMWLAVFLCGMSIWTYKVFNTAQAYSVAKTALENRIEIDDSLGKYDISHDLWFSVFSALRYGEVQRFEFHINGNKDEAASYVEVVKTEDKWEVSCVYVVNGEYLNKIILNECSRVQKT